MLTILGIDPGSRITGYGLICIEGSRQTYLSSGCLVTQAKNFSERLKEIFHGITQIIEQHSPDEVAVEEVFVSRNVSSALKLGHARGAAIVAAASQSLPIAEYPTRRVKQSVVGYGGADKNQVQHMVKCLLGLSGKPAEDAADALAVALCHAQMRASLLQRSKRERL